jgi:asparagine synthase (glutamine-hydrolysing)
MGKKPLFYRDAGGEVAFASELQALLSALGSTPEIDPEALDLFLAYACVPGERSIFSGVRKLPPAHVAAFDAKGSSLRRYWELSFRDKSARGEDELLAELDSLLSDATRIRMIADVPLGAFLSGGVDSSVVVAHMSRLASGVRTFAIGFPEERFNELPHAAKVARHCGTVHEELVIKPDAAEILPRLVWHYGEPFGDASAVPTYYVAQAARRHVTVALNGDGGDESFAGYDWCRREAILQRYRESLPLALRRGPLRALGTAAAFLPGRAGHQLGAMLTRGAQTVGETYWNWDLWGEAERSRLYRPAWRQRLAGFRARAHLEDLFARGTAGEDLDRALEAMIHLYLPDDLLVKADIASMANSLEPRSPLLDYRIVEFAARLPTSLKVRGGLTKALLKRHAADLVPREVVYRPKQGFSVPLADWLRGALRPSLAGILLHPRALERGYFQPDALRALVQSFLGGAEHATRLWGLLWLEIWHLLFIDKAIAPGDSLRQV